MSHLSDIIKSLGYDVYTPSVVLSKLQEMKHTELHTYQQSLASPLKVLTDTEYRTLCTDLSDLASQDVVMDQNLKLLNGIGLDWSDAKFQMSLTGIAMLKQWPQTMLDKLLAIGIKRYNDIEKYSLTNVTLTTVTEALSIITTEKNCQALISFVIDRYTTVLSQINNKTLTTLEQVKTAMGS